ncbi:MAG: hypothetical protein IK078_06115 [Lachnospiraceae bacterium]|nr:hypothetical protein [Lachnospiraceae bacterium]
MLAIFEVLFLVVSNTGRGLSVLATAWLVVTVLVFAGSAALLLIRIRSAKGNGKNNDDEKKSEKASETENKSEKENGIEKEGIGESSSHVSVVLPLLISAAVIMAAVCISKVPAVSEQYRTAETTVVILRDGSFFGTDPLTGLWLADVTLDQRTEALPAFYAVLCHFTGMTKPWQLLGTVAALWMILLALSVLYEAADRLLGLKDRRFWVLCLVFCLCAFCVGGAYRNPFYDLLHVPYEGRTVLSFLILPMIFLSVISLSGISKQGSEERNALNINGTEVRKKSERSNEAKHERKGSMILRTVLCLLTSVLAAACVCGIGCGLFPALCELLVLVLCLIGWNLQKRFTA